MASKTQDTFLNAVKSVLIQNFLLRILKMTNESQISLPSNKPQYNKRMKDQELLFFGGIEDPFNEHEFRENYTQYKPNANTDLIAPQLSSNLLMHSPHKPKIPFSKLIKHSGKKHRHDDHNDVSTDNRHSKFNDGIPIISKRLNFGKGRNRSNSISSNSQAKPALPAINESHSSSQTSDNEKDHNTPEKEIIQPIRRKILRFFKNRKSKVIAEPNLIPIQKSISNPPILSTDIIVSQKESKKIQINSILQNELLDLQRSKSADNFLLNVNADSIESFFLGANHHIGQIFRYQGVIDSTGIEDSKKLLKHQAKVTTKSLSLTSEKVNRLHNKFSTLKDTMNETSNQMNMTHQKIDFLHTKIRNLIDDIGIEFNDSDPEIDESWFEYHSTQCQKLDDDSSKTRKEYNILAIFSFIYFYIIAFAQMCISSIKLDRYATAPKVKRKTNKKAQKKRKTRPKSKTINKMIKIVKIEPSD